MNWNTIGAAMTFGASGLGVGTQAEIVDFGLANIGWGVERLSVYIPTDEIPCTAPNAEDMLLEHEAIVKLDSADAPVKIYEVSPGKIGRCYHSDISPEECIVEVIPSYEEIRIDFEVDASESDRASDRDDEGEFEDPDDLWLADFELEWEPAINDERPFYDFELDFDGDSEGVMPSHGSADREPVRKMSYRYEDPKPRGKTARRIYIGVPKAERVVPYSGGVRYELNRAGYDSYGHPRNIHNFQLRLEHGIAQRDTELDAWLQGRRVLKVDEVFYWGNPVERIVSKYDFTVEITGYRQTTLLTAKDIETLNSLDSRGKAKAFGEKESTGTLIPYWRYPHWEKRRPQSWKRGKSRRQYRLMGGHGNPFKGMDGFEPVARNEPEWDIDLEDDLLANVEAYYELVSAEERTIELDRLDRLYMYDGFISYDAYDMWEPHGFFRDPHFEEDQRNFLNGDDYDYFDMLDAYYPSNVYY